MRSNSKSIGLSVASFVALAVFAPNASAQLQQGPAQGLPQVQTEGAKPSPLRDFQQMIETQRSQMQSRVAAAAERVQSACRMELQNFCSTVTPGEGRLLLCMQAHEDKLGNQCEVALFETSRNIQAGRAPYRACCRRMRPRYSGALHRWQFHRPVHDRKARLVVASLPGSGRRTSPTLPAGSSRSSALWPDCRYSAPMA